MTDNLQHVGIKGMHWGHRSASGVAYGNRAHTHKGVEIPTVMRGSRSRLVQVDKKGLTGNPSPAHQNFQAGLDKLNKNKQVTNADLKKLSIEFYKDRAKEVISKPTLSQKYSNLSPTQKTKGKKIVSAVIGSGLLVAGIYAASHSGKSFIDAKSRNTIFKLASGL